MRQAHAFLTWLDSQGLALNSLTQSDLDRWTQTSRPDQREAVLEFLTWARRHHLSAALTLKPPPHRVRAPISQRERLTWLSRTLDPDDLDPDLRVVLTIVLLYAQPIPRVCQLTIHDLTCHPDDGLFIQLGTPASPVAAPFDTVLLDYLEHQIQPTAATQTSDWLFPGRHGTLPKHPTSFRTRLHALGFSPSRAKAAALRQLVLQAPPAIIGPMLGYRTTTAEQHSKHAATTWSRYIALRQHAN